MNDSSENVAQAGRGCAAPSCDELRKQRNLGPLALRSPPIFIISRRRSQHKRLLRIRGTRCHPCHYPHFSRNMGRWFQPADAG